MIFINFQHGKMPKETVDEFSTRNEALAMLREYNMAAPIGCRYWLSSRCCRNWRES